MNLKSLFVSLLVILFFADINVFAQKIDPVLQEEMNQRANDEKIDVFVIMQPQYDRATLNRGAYSYTNRSERREYVVNELKSFAETSQSDLRKSLDVMEKSNMTTSPKIIWIANALAFSATKEAIEEISKRGDVLMIGWDKEEYMLFDESSKPAPNTREMTSNVSQVRANEVWTLGYTGEGVVVAVIDTGVNYNHQDLADHLWDGGTEFPYHGWDFVNNDNNPMDDHGHGTHCAGTVCGDGSAGSQTGMAPDASLMILKCLNSAGRGSTANITNSMQWAVEHGCDIISLSLGASGATLSTRIMYRNACEAVLDAGVVAAIAAGNDGDDLATYPIPFNVGVPGGCPPPYIDPRQALNPGGLSCSVCVGAVDVHDNPAYFTSNGPYKWDDTEFGDYPYTSGSAVEFGLIRPDVSAPGVSIKSAYYASNNGYTTMSGTSMATPCVAGCMALVLSKDPNVTPAEMCKLLEETAVPLSDTKSNLTGTGRIDVFAAIKNMPTGNLKLDSFVINDSNGNNDGLLNPGESVKLTLSLRNDSNSPIDNASIVLSTESSYINITNATYQLPHINGNQTIVVDNAFSFVVDNDVLPSNVIAFTADVVINDETVGTLPLSIVVYDYMYNCKEFVFLDDDNGNGFLEPGESANMRIYLENGGNIQANSVVGTLSSDYLYLTIEDAVKSLGDMPQLSQSYADFHLTLNGNAPQNYKIDFLLTLVDANNRQNVLEFDHVRYAVTVATNLADAGTIIGNGFYDRGTTCTLTATPNEGYLFENWSIDGGMVNTKMSYSFVVTENTECLASYIKINGVYIGSGEDIDYGLPGATSGVNSGSLSQQIYTAGEIGQAGYIRSIAFYNDGNYQNSNYSVYLKHTNKTAFQSGTDWVTVSESDLVYNGQFVFNRGVWTILEFDKLFLYDGTSNLVVVVDDNTGIYNPAFGRAFNANGYQTLYISGTNDYDPLNPTSYSGYRKSTKNQIILDVVSQNATMTVSVTPNDADGGTVSGGNTYYFNTPCTVTATPNDGYVFMNWTEKGEVVSTESSYTFTVYDNRNLVANFYSTNPISFEDAVVKDKCVANWDTNGDGELSYAEAAAVTDLGTVFRYNHNITSFNEFQYFKGLTAIANWGFIDCNNLTSVIIPNYVKTINTCAFYGCSSLTAIEIPAYLTSIGQEVFENCYNLEQIIVSEDNETFDSRNNCNAIIKTSTNQLIAGCNNTIIPNTVVSIANYAFVGLKGLTSIEIPVSIKSIGLYAFEHNYLNQITVHPDNLYFDSRNECNAIIKTSDNSLVVGCRNTVIPNTVTIIGSMAFYQCDSLTSIVIPASVNTINSYAFYNCNNLESIDVMALNPPTVYNESVFYNVDRNIPVTVYCESIGLYPSSPVWNIFANYKTYDACPQEITVSAYPLDGGIVFGAGQYLSGDSCSLTATPNDGFLFLNWSKNGEVVSVNVENTFVVSTGGEYVANFMELNGLYIGEGETVSKYLPTYYNYSMSQQIYTADEIGAGEIHGIAFYNAGADDIRDFTIYIKTTEKESFNTTYTWSGSSTDWIPVSAEDMVFSGDVLMNKGNWNFITFDTPFVSDGISNIVIVVDDNSNSSSSDYMECRVFDTKSRQSIYVYSYSTNYDPYNMSASGTTGYVKNQLIMDIVRPDSFAVNVTKDVDEAGTVTGGGSFEYGSTCTLEATVNAGYTFRYWSDNGKMLSSDRVYSFAVKRDYNITAIFSEDAPIPFADANVKAICITNWDSRGDGEFSFGEAAAVSNLGNAFKNNNIITSFDELQFFTGLNEIGGDAFYYCSNLKSVEFPNTVTSIGSWAFYACSSLESITIPSSIASIGNYSFGFCSKISEMTVNATTPPVIGSNTFRNVDKTIPVHIPYGTLTAYQTAQYWNEFTNFQESEAAIILFADANVKDICVENWDTNHDGELSYNEAAAVTDLGEVFKSNHDIISFNELQYFTGLTEIGDYAFYYAIHLSVIALPNTITTIGHNAFYQCYDLLSIEIPSSVTMIEDEAFGYTHNLAHITVDPNNTVYDSRNDCNAIINSITNALLVGCYNTIIPNSVTTIERYAFRGCSNLTSITLPNSITTIESETFYGCSGLTSITIPSSVSSMGSHMFASCNIAQIVVEQGNTHYDSRDNCNAIIDSETNALIVGCKNTIIPNTVTKIASSAFYACYGLTSIVIPQNVIELSYLAFYCCMNLDSITLNCVVPPTVGENAFGAVDKSIPVYVPCGAESAYSTAQGWNEFTNILCHESVQEFNLSAGWNWWSTYIEQDNIDGLDAIETEMSLVGFEIRSQKAFVQNDIYDGLWYGTLETLTNEDGYMINVLSDCAIDMTGSVANSQEHPISIHKGWTWIGYPIPVQHPVSVALNSFTPSDGDFIKSFGGLAVYSDADGWTPDSFVLTPGEGYKYYSQSLENKILTYNNSGAKADIVNDKLYWNTDAHLYADNMAVVATVFVSDVEQRDLNLELGAFVNNECRGSSKLVYIKSKDRYYALMTISGNNDEKVSFAIVNHETNAINNECNQSLVIDTDAIIGDLHNPYEIHFGEKGINEIADFGIYPNPVTVNQPFVLSIPDDEVVSEIIITNSLGATVRQEVSSQSNIAEGISVSGVYVIKVTSCSGNVYYGKLVVK